MLWFVLVTSTPRKRAERLPMFLVTGALLNQRLFLRWQQEIQSMSYSAATQTSQNSIQRDICSLLTDILILISRDLMEQNSSTKVRKSRCLPMTEKTMQFHIKLQTTAGLLFITRA